ncbi:MAG: hypothetical protein KatS3mg032_2252 [Cyclobacteriaceae bacterium]|nr:MAG: hypothetical protein KatS3mg032_2252 [Cyclobacteriaceae bacterium]
MVLICLSLAGWAQLSPERMVLNSLEKGKYHKAYTQIARMLARDTGSVAARFLLVRYFFSPANPGYNIDSAHHYCRAGMASLAHTHGKARERLIRFAIDSALFLRLQQSIDSAAFKRAQDLNTEAAYQYFLDRFPQARQRPQAIELRDEVAFLTALRENTWQSFKHFLDKYPQSHRAPDAQVRYDRLLYQTKTSDGRLNSYRAFVSEHPGSPYRHEAEWHILQLSTALCTPPPLLDFIITFPQSRHRRFALNLLYHLLKEHDEPFPSGLLTDSLRHVNDLEKQHLIPVYRNGKFAWMNPAGKEVIAPLAEYLPETLKCGYAADDVLPAGNLLIARNGTVLARQVEESADLGYGFLVVRTNDCNYVLHKSGKKLTGCIDDARVVGSSIMAVQTNNRWSLISFAGLVLMENTDGFYDFGPVLGIKRGTQTLLILREEVKLLADGQQPGIQHVVDEAKNLPKGIWVRMGKNEAMLGYDLAWLIPPFRTTH